MAGDDPNRGRHEAQRPCIAVWCCSHRRRRCLDHCGLDDLGPAPGPSTTGVCVLVAGGVGLIRHDGRRRSTWSGVRRVTKCSGGPDLTGSIQKQAPLPTGDWRSAMFGRPCSPETARGTSVTPTIVEEQVVKSRHRVKTYGEVFTPRHMVDRMLDLVREESGDRPRLRRQDFPRACSRATATSWSRSCTASSARSRRTTRPRTGPRRRCSLWPRSTASSCWRTTTRTPRWPCSPSSCASTRTARPRVAPRRTCGEPRPSSSTRTSFAATR